MSKADRWLGDVMWHGTPYGANEVRRLGKYARCNTGDRLLHEFDLGCFWVTDLWGDEPERQLHLDQDDVPEGPWFHGPLCDCGECNAVRV